MPSPMSWLRKTFETFRHLDKERERALVQTVRIAEGRTLHQKPPSQLPWKFLDIENEIATVPDIREDD